LVAFGPKESTVEDALARAIEGAVSAGRWDIVAQLAKELEARRLAAAGVMRLADPTVADAICDRVLHGAHKLALQGPSRRKTKELASES
jgi:hypothetical protein